jgi:hypothetical protein
MEPKDLSLELKELREVTISSNLTTCYLILEELLSVKEETIHYQEFSEHWIDTYKDVYKLIAKMKTG